MSDPEFNFDNEMKIADTLYKNKNYCQALKHYVMISNNWHQKSNKFKTSNIPSPYLPISIISISCIRIKEIFAHIKKSDFMDIDFYHSISHGNCVALCVIGHFYYAGINVGQDYNEAFKYYKMASDKDHCDGHYTLANMYISGSGVEQNLEKGLNYIKMAKKSNFPYSYSYFTNLCAKIGSEYLDNGNLAKGIRYLIASLHIDNNNITVNGKDISHKILELCTEHEKLQTELYYSPNGKGYMEAEKEFKVLAKVNSQ